MVLLALLLADNPGRSLFTGTYGEPQDGLMIAVDGEARRFSGYYDGGQCRFSFRGPLHPTSLERRQTYTEGYEAEGWEPDHPERIFPIILYSQVPDGYRQQITVEPGGRGKRPAACPSRFSLDRFGSNSDTFVAVRVVKAGRARLYGVQMKGKRATVMPKVGRPPRPWAGVWIESNYSPGNGPASYRRITWYVSGWPHGAYVRSSALFPLPAERDH